MIYWPFVIAGPLFVLIGIGMFLCGAFWMR